MDVVAALRAAGCVRAEDEAALLSARFTNSRLAAAVARRASGVPLEQVLGAASFAGVSVKLGEGCFVPRARAAALVDVAARVGSAASVVVDLGTGCGALAAAIAARLPSAQVHAVEVDDGALAWARINASTFGFTVHAGSWWSALPASLRGSVDVAVAYLPHVPTAHLDRIHADFRLHEPLRSVDGGSDGIDPLRDVVAGTAEWLAPGGSLVTLVAAEQVDDTLRIAPFAVEEAGEDAVLVLDQAR
jgi:release factor glutamine methyltransferase